MSRGPILFEGLCVDERTPTALELSEGILRVATLRDHALPLAVAHVVTMRTERRTGPFYTQQIAFYCDCKRVSCNPVITYERFVERTKPKPPAPPAGAAAVAA